MLLGHLFFLAQSVIPSPYTLSLHDALPISTPAPSAPPAVTDEFILELRTRAARNPALPVRPLTGHEVAVAVRYARSEEHTSELQSRQYLVCRLLLEKKQTIEN